MRTALADADIRHVAHAQRRGAPRRTSAGDLAISSGGLHAARGAHDDLLAAELNHAAARVLDVLADGVGQFAESDTPTSLELCPGRAE